MMTNNEHPLPGLESDNLLAFMALLGALRAIERERPSWHPRVRWEVRNPPARAVLQLSEPVSKSLIGETIAAGCDLLAQDHEFGKWKVPSGPRQEATSLLADAVRNGPAKRPHADLLAALFSNIAVKNNQDSVLPTPLCLLFGQGHQYFLDRLAAVAKLATPPLQGRAKEGIALTPGETIERALFTPWRRADAAASFRWDPEEDRRYALRFSDPSKDTALTEHGANRMAAVGLAVFTVVPATVRKRIRLNVVGLRPDAPNVEVRWPIWTIPLSLNAIRSILTHPALHRETPDYLRLRAMGIHEVRRAMRISVGKFLNFTRAVAV